MATNYYGELGNYKGDFSGGTQAKNPKNNIVIGGVSFGRNWTDSDAAALQHMQLQASIDQQLAEREYNSPAAQVQRMRQAGINPDMQSFDNGNGSISAGVGSPSGQPASSRTQVIMHGVQSMVEMIPQAVEVVQRFQATRLSLEKSNTELDNLAEQIAIERQARVPYSAISGEDDSIYPIFTGDISDKRFRKRIESAAKRYSPTSPEVANAWWNRQSLPYSGRSTYAHAFGKGSGKESDSVFIDAVHELYKAERDALESSHKSKKSQSDFSTDYYDAKDGSVIGSAETQSAVNSSLQELGKVLDDKIAKLWDTNPTLAAVLYIVKTIGSNISISPKGIGF